MPKTVLAFNGGLDCTTLLWELRDVGHDVLCVWVDWGQATRLREIERVYKIAAEAGATVRPVVVGGLMVAEPPKLQRGRVPVWANHGMLVLSACLPEAKRTGAHDISIGVRIDRNVDETDRALALCTASFSADRIGLNAPYRDRTQEEIVRRALKLNVPLAETWSCYESGRWHCGTCHGCKVRRAAFLQATVQDPVRYAVEQTCVMPFGGGA